MVRLNSGGFMENFIAGTEEIRGFEIRLLGESKLRARKREICLYSRWFPSPPEEIDRWCLHRFRRYKYQESLVLF